MALNVTIDTNIILDALLKREPWHEAAEQIILLSASKKINASISASTVTDIYYIISRKICKPEAKETILKLSKLMNFTTVDHSDCVKALTTGIDDFEDSLLSVSAAKSKSKYIVTRNAKHFENSKVLPIEPDEFLKLV